MEIPQELKQALENQIQGIKTKLIIDNSQKISKKYRENTESKKLTKREEALSYSISRMPSTYCAVYSALKHTLENIDEKINTSLDIGAGTGAATWAISQLTENNKNICLEREEVMADIGKELMNGTYLEDTEWRKFDIINNQSNETADLVMTSYMLNELPEEEKANVIKKLWNMTDKILLIVEPGTPAGFKNILKAREILLQEKASIIAPCRKSK